MPAERNHASRKKPCQQKETMISFAVPPAQGLVWHLVYLEWQGKEYVFFTDSFSGWTELYRAKTRTPAALTRIARLHMMRQGIPRQVHTDQGLSYRAQEFQDFCKKWGVNLTVSSPKHPKGNNSIAEAMVEKIKHVLKGASSEDEIVAAFVAMNQTPLAPGRPSPTELHFGRNLRDELHEKVEQKNPDWGQVKEWKEAVRALAKKKYDENARELEDLEGQPALVRWETKWRQAEVSGKIRERPRAYRLWMKDKGKEVERNRIMIRPVVRSTNKNVQLSHLSPHELFQQEAPVLRQGRRSIGVITTEPPQEERINDLARIPTMSILESPPPPPPIQDSATSNKAPGPSLSRLTKQTRKPKSPAPEKTMEYVPVPATTSGRTVKKPEVLDL
jgi:hypothetical protein